MARRTLAVPSSAALLTGCAVLLAGCGGLPQLHLPPMPKPGWPSAKHPKIDPELPVLPAAGSGRGGYYQDDGPGDNPPPNLRDLPNAVFKDEPYSRYANRPYVVFGKTYEPLLGGDPFVQRGVASWYGKKFHGQRTSSGELYDMYKMTAAHPTLPIPSFARITSLETGNQVVVRINDRGPFHASRIIDVSYVAALKLGLLGKGSHQVEVERLLADDVASVATRRRNAPLVDTVPVVAPTGMAELMLEERMPADSADAAPAPAPTPAAPASGYYLQLGAFSRADKAAEIRELLTRAGALSVTLDIVQAGAVHRLFGGPFASRAEALKAAQGLPRALGITPVVVRRGGAG